MEAQTAIVFAEEDEYGLWKDNGATSNLRDRGNSRATYYKNKRKVEDLKSSAKGSLDIRSFFQVQDEDEDSDDTIDEMEMNSFIPRMEMLPEVPNRYSQEDALEKLLPLVKITRNKKIEAKNDKMMWRHCRYLAVIRYLQLRAAGEGKVKASVNAASKYYDNQGADSYKSRSIRD